MGNSERRYVGHSDEPLSVEGERQVRQMGVCFDTRQVFASPLARAVQTARLLFPRAELTLLPGLREMDFGDFTGLTAQELRHDADYQKWLDSGCAIPCPGGEGMADFTERACAAFAQAVECCMQTTLVKNKNSLKTQNSKLKTGLRSRPLVIVAHGGVIMAVMSRWARPARPYFDWQVKTAACYRALLDEHTWREKPALTDYALLTGLEL